MWARPDGHPSHHESNNRTYPGAVALRPPPRDLEMADMTRRNPSAAEIIADLAFRRGVERIHGLGVRATAELLAELGAERGIQHVIDEKVARYADLDPGVVRALGGDHFASPPLVVVKSDDEEMAP